MPRALLRIAVGLIGAAVLVIGVGATAAGAWITANLGGQDSLRTAVQRVAVADCTTAVFEIADARVDFDQLDRLNAIEAIAERSGSALTISVDGRNSSPWLVGIADQADVQERLLGARYCLVEVRDGRWTSIPIAVEPDAPDVDLSGVPGVWAYTDVNVPVAVPVPATGSALVVSGSGDSVLATIDLAGRYDIQGASDAGFIALAGGIGLMIVGAIVILVSVLVLRRHGRHEASGLGSPT